MYHTDSHIYRLLRGTDRHLFPLIINFAPIRFVDSRQYIHQCTFSGSVLPEERMDLAGVKLQIHVLIRYNRTKGLRNFLHLKNKF